VPREALLAAMYDAATILDIMGGVISVVTARHPTDLEGEMVTTGAVVEWRQMVKTKARPENFEQATELPSTPAPDLTDREEEALIRDLPDPEVAALAEVRSEEPDGLDYGALPEEDDSAVEEPVR
jgi:hypothetical protein